MSSRITTEQSRSGVQSLGRDPQLSQGRHLVIQPCARSRVRWQSGNALPWDQAVCQWKTNSHPNKIWATLLSYSSPPPTLLLSCRSYSLRQLHPFHMGHWASPVLKSRNCRDKAQMRKMEFAINAWASQSEKQKYLCELWGAGKNNK